jgi:hypothetical protein
VQSWDTANKATELSDFSVCTTSGIKGKNLYFGKDGCPKPEKPVPRRLDELGPFWLELRGCYRIVYLPLPLMAQKQGTDYEI